MKHGLPESYPFPLQQWMRPGQEIGPSVWSADQRFRVFPVQTRWDWTCWFVEDLHRPVEDWQREEGITAIVIRQEENYEAAVRSL